MPHSSTVHNVHSELVGILARNAAQILLTRYGKSNSPGFKRLLSQEVGKTAKNLWEIHGREIEMKASEIIKHGARVIGVSVTIDDHHIHTGAQFIATEIWSRYH